MGAQTNPKKENTATCEICGKPLERWENNVHLACYTENTAMDITLKRVRVPETFRKTIKEGKVILPYETFGKALLDGSTMGLLFIGEPGTGKTILSCYLATQYILKRKGTARYINLPEFFHELRESYRSKETVNPRQFDDIDLLILDDVGAENTTEWSSEMLYLIINNRYEKEKQTIVTTNLDLQTLAERVGDRIVSRIVGMCRKVNLKEEDQRLDQHKESNGN